LSDTKVYEPQIRALLGTALHAGGIAESGAILRPSGEDGKAEEGHHAALKAGAKEREEELRDEILLHKSMSLKYTSL